MRTRGVQALWPLQNMAHKHRTAPHRVRRALSMRANLCPPGGCTNAPKAEVDIRRGTLLWSDPATWSDRSRFPRGKPRAGDNVRG